MALLTAEDVLNKAFSKTKYREGFDQDEVDDFLDEVANTIAQLTAERDEAVARAGSGAPAAAAPVEAAPVTSAGGVPGTTGLLAAATEPGAANPTGMLAMAQKLHDEYVQAGEAERDRIVDEAHSAADQIRERADEDAKSRMDELAGERVDLEGRIDDLRRFERDYRARLKAYLENLLGDLDHAGVAGAAGLAALGTEIPGDDSGSHVEADAADDADAYVVEEVAVADAYEGEEGEPDIVVVEQYEGVTPVSFDEALGGYEPAPAAADAPEAPDAPQSFEQAAFEPEAPAAPVTPPTFDSSQPWESQLRPPADGAVTNPFAPVTEPGDAAPFAPGDVPGVAAAEEGEEPPFTPPSSRMFNDLYGQQRPDQENQN
jgi:DivIVA domain-containing protein